MRLKSGGLGLRVTTLWLASSQLFAQGFLAVDQASGTTNELLQVFTQIPDNQIAQSFTPVIPAVGFVQLQTVIFANSSGETLVINLRQGAFNGPIIGTTTPEFLANRLIEISTFYFPGDVALTPGQLYFFEPVLQSAGPLDVGVKENSTYDRGVPWINGGPSGPGDFWFREGIVVPEPGTVWLLVLSGTLLLWRRRAWRGS